MNAVLANLLLLPPSRTLLPDTAVMSPSALVHRPADSSVHVLPGQPSWRARARLPDVAGGWVARPTCQQKVNAQAPCLATCATIYA